MTTFGKRLKRLRLDSNKTLDELKDIFKTTKATLSRYENDKVPPKSEFVKLAAEYFGVSIDYIMGSDEKPLSQNATIQEKASKEEMQQIAEEVVEISKKLDIKEIKALKSILDGGYTIADLKNALITLEQFAQLKKKQLED